MGISSHPLQLSESRKQTYFSITTRETSSIWHAAVDLGARNVPAMDQNPAPAPRTVNVRIVGNEKHVLDEVVYFENICRTVELQTWGNLIAFAMKQRRRAGEGEKKSGVISQRISPKQLSTLISTNDTGRKDPEISTKLYVKADF